MPELPEVETIKRGLESAMRGAQFNHVVVKRGNLRYPFPEDFAIRLENKTVQKLTRRAKYILVFLSSSEVLMIHLGMSGRFLIENTHEKKITNIMDVYERRHDHVIFQLSNGKSISYRDPRRFGFMDLVGEEKLSENTHLSQLGIEPLNDTFHAQTLYLLLQNKRVSLKAALLDQRLIAGLGNIYVCEALYKSHLHPGREARTLCLDEAALLARSIKSVLEEALIAGGSTLKDYRQTDGSSGYFQHSFSVYGREHASCLTSGCLGNIQRIVQNGRSTFFCPQCQPEHTLKAVKQNHRK